MIRLYIFIKSLIIKSLIIIKLDELPAVRPYPQPCCLTRRQALHAACCIKRRKATILAHNNMSSRCPS